MIGRLSGKLLEKQAPYLLIDVQGVGYEVQTSLNTFYRLPEPNESLMLYTHFSVREDGHYLYGFFEERERLLFRALIKVNGVGPKLALAILSSIEPDVFVECVATQDTARLTRLPGIGKKTAERLVIEMRDRLIDFDVSAQPGQPLITSPLTSADQAIHDATAALVSLGYKPQQASQVIRTLSKEYTSSEALIRQALKSLARETA